MPKTLDPLRFLLTAVAGWMNQEQQHAIAYLGEENRLLRAHLGPRRIAWRSGAGGRRQLIWFDRSGKNAGTLGAADDPTIIFPELSPEGKRAAVSRGSAGSFDIWIQEGARSSRFTFDPADDAFPIWSPDGARVVFRSNRKGSVDLYQKAADGSGSEEPLLQSADTKVPESWSPDGRFILYAARRTTAI